MKSNEGQGRPTLARNGMMELWRLLFTGVIVCGHVSYLPWYTSQNVIFRSGYLPVEFFFILSGYLMAQSAVKRKEVAQSAVGDETWRFLWGKVKTIYPTYLFSLLLGLVILYCLPGANKPLAFSEYAYGFWDALFLRNAGLQGSTMLIINGAAWYLSAMLLGMLLLYPLLYRHTDVFLHIVAPALSIFIMGWFSNVYGNIRLTLEFQNGIGLGLVRGIGGLCVGCCCYAVCLRLKQKSFGKLPRMFMTLLELAAFALALGIMQGSDSSQNDFLCVALLAVGVTICFSGISYTSKISARHLGWIASFSLTLYLVHINWAKMLKSWALPIAYPYQLLAYLALSFISTLICMNTLAFLKQLYLWLKAKRPNSKRERIQEE